MGAKTIIVNSWPPILKVSGDLIKVLFEVETTTTVKKRLDEKGIKYGDFVKTDVCINAMTESELEKPFVSYSAKSKGSDRL
jgi:hypothetical protein